MSLPPTNTSWDRHVPPGRTSGHVQTSPLTLALLSPRRSPPQPGIEFCQDRQRETGLSYLGGIFQHAPIRGAPFPAGLPTPMCGPRRTPSGCGTAPGCPCPTAPRLLPREHLSPQTPLSISGARTQAPGPGKSPSPGTWRVASRAAPASLGSPHHH